MKGEIMHIHPRATRRDRTHSWVRQLRRALLPLLLFAALFPTAQAQAQAQDDKPNLLFLFADDFAPDAIAALGNPTVKTPVLDQLAAQSTSFSNAYNQGAWTGAVCRSSRDMLESGQFLWNAQADAATRIRSGQGATELLSEGGYDTYFAGKLHLSDGLTAAELGFDQIGTVRPPMPVDYGVNGAQAGSYYARPAANGADTWDSTDTSLGGFWDPNTGVHWNETLADEGIGFLQQAANDNDPFYMQLSFNAPHDPRQAPAEYLNMYSLDDIDIPANFPASGTYEYASALGLDASLRDENVAPFPRSELAVKTHLREYYAAISYMDAQIGRVLAELDRTGQRDDTYVVLAGDHGLAVGQHGLMGKQNMFEHSMRTPLLISGPGISQGESNDARVYYQDLMPTMLELAGVPVPSGWQFRSLLPILRGERSSNYDAIYGAYDDTEGRSAQRMVVQDDHKLILYPELSPPVALLYDLIADPDEMTDLFAAPGYAQRRSNLFTALLGLQAETGDVLDLVSAYPDLVSVTTRRVEAESYSSATDTDTANLGGAPQFAGPADVWPHASGPEGQRDGFVVGRTRGGETLTYTGITVDPGLWRVAASWSSGDPDPGGMNLYVDDQLIGNVDATTGHWWVFESSTFGDVGLSAEPHTLRVEFTGAGQINLDYLELVRVGDLPSSTTRVEAESYSAATDTDTANVGGAPQFPAPADVWPHASGPEGQRDGFVVGRTRGGETLSYNVNLDEGLWRFDASWSSGHPNPGGMNLYVDGQLVGDVDATTGHWWVFESSTFGEIGLAGGPHTLRVEFTDAGEINLDYLDLTRVGDFDPASWTVTCPTPPSWVRAGQSFGLTAQVQPLDAREDLRITWSLGDRDFARPLGSTSSGPLSSTAPTAGQELPLRITATDGAATRTVQCRGVVIVEPDATVVGVGQDLQQAITAAGPRATVYLDRGTHTGHLNVRLRDEQTISGFTDTNGDLLSVLDGQGTENVLDRRQTAFISNPGEDHPQGVTIRSLEFTNWTTYQGPDGSLQNSGFHGVIHVQAATTTALDSDRCTAVRRNPTGWGEPIDWTIEQVNIHDNDGAGIVLSSGVTVRDSVIDDNAHIGIGGTFVKDALITNVTVRRNALHPDVLPNFHSGGVKLTRANGVQILSSEFTGNGGPGIWLDIDTWGNRVIDNVASNNTTFGIFQEISWASEIRDNTTLNNGDADILVSESGGYVDADNTTITLNVVENNLMSDSEIALRMADRKCGFDTFRAADGYAVVPSTAITDYLVQHNVFFNNGPTGIGSDDLVEPGPWVPRTVPVGGNPGAGVPGADGPIEAMVTTTCLAGNGRTDINIVNTGTSAATYRIEFGSLSPRQRTVAAGDWWRMPITGRADGPHDLLIARNGSVVRDEPVTVSCDTNPPILRSPEVQIVNACRAGLGYVIFQFANSNASDRSWVIEFESVPNRSTSAAAFGASARAVTGRRTGTYEVLVRSGAERLAFDITVDC